MADRVGEQFGNYRLTRRLGEGAFAEVYLAEHRYIKTQAAIKVLASLEPEDRQKFQDEASKIANLEHPHIVKVLEFGVEREIPFLVMTFAPNGTLRQHFPRGKQIPIETLLPYITQAGAALQYIHDLKLIHQDVKPENLLLGVKNEVLLSDFGLATLAESTRSQKTGNPAGTAQYMAPEQWDGKPHPASDQYALGISVYEWLAGGRPFQGTTSALMAQHLRAVPPPLRQKVPTILPDVELVVLTALKKEPHERFGSVRAFVSALEQASQKKSVPAGPYAAPPPAPASEKKPETPAPPSPVAATPPKAPAPAPKEATPAPAAATPAKKEEEKKPEGVSSSAASPLPASPPVPAIEKKPDVLVFPPPTAAVPPNVPAPEPKDQAAHLALSPPPSPAGAESVQASQASTPSGAATKKGAEVAKSAKASQADTPGCTVLLVYLGVVCAIIACFLPNIYYTQFNHTYSYSLIDILLSNIGIFPQNDLVFLFALSGLEPFGALLILFIAYKTGRVAQLFSVVGAVAGIVGLILLFIYSQQQLNHQCPSGALLCFPSSSSPGFGFYLAAVGFGLGLIGALIGSINAFRKARGVTTRQGK